MSGKKMNTKYGGMAARDKTSRQIEDSLRVNRATWKDTYTKGESYNSDMSVKLAYIADDEFAVSPASPVSPVVKVFHEDVYTLLDILREEGFRNPNPLFVNPGNNNNPIPGVKKGADGDEMELLRRSNYFKALEESMYPILEEEVLYSPTVVVFKNAKGKRIEKPVSISIVNVPPLIRPGLMSVSNPSGSGYVENFESSNDRERTRKRINMMFKTAITRGHDTIIITNYGGGTCQNPLNEITRLFNEAIVKYPVPYVFFAVKTHERREKDREFLTFHAHIRRA
jgi:hypothetical protein